jgi:hypothetical protein
MSSTKYWGAWFFPPFQGGDGGGNNSFMGRPFPVFLDRINMIFRIEDLGRRGIMESGNAPCQAISRHFSARILVGSSRAISLPRSVTLWTPSKTSGISVQPRIRDSRARPARYSPAFSSSSRGGPG